MQLKDNSRHNHQHDYYYSPSYHFPCQSFHYAFEWGKTIFFFSDFCFLLFLKLTLKSKHFLKNFSKKGHFFSSHWFTEKRSWDIPSLHLLLCTVRWLYLAVHKAHCYALLTIQEALHLSQWYYLAVTHSPRSPLFSSLSCLQSAFLLVMGF